MTEDRLNLLKTLSAASAALVIPIALAYIGNQYTSALKEREIQAQYVKLAVDILQGTPAEGNKSVRTWATKIINKYSGVPLGAEAEKALIETVPIAPSIDNRFVAARTPDGIKEVQTLLKQLGFYAGEVTGVGDDATIDAIKAFQADNDIVPDAILGPRTLARLRERAAQQARP